MSSHRRYNSIDSVSSLSLSSSSSSEDSDTRYSQYTALTSLSRMGKYMATDQYGRAPGSHTSFRSIERKHRAGLTNTAPALASEDEELLPKSPSRVAPIVHQQRPDRRDAARHHANRRFEDARDAPLECLSNNSPSTPGQGYASPSAAASHPQASSPHTFSQYFPSSLPLYIHHPATIDGNLNLSIDVQSRDGPLTLFHLRMHNLRAREFSLRRYCRESGREICHSTRKGKKLSEIDEKQTRRHVSSDDKRRSISFGSMTRGIGGVWSKAAHRHDAKSRTSLSKRTNGSDGAIVAARSRQTPKTPAGPARADSGYGSGSASGSPTPSLQAAAATAHSNLLRTPDLHHLSEEPEDLSMEDLDIDYDEEEEEEEEEEETEDARQGSRRRRMLPKNMTKLEFSNYTHLDLRRRGKGHDFEYWGTKYTWTRVLKSESRKSFSTGSSQTIQRSYRQQSSAPSREIESPGMSSTVEYHLHIRQSSLPLAAITPNKSTRQESAIEAELGSWVPPCTFRITDSELLKAHNAADVCDVLIATGLLALTDDCIRRHWHESGSILGRLPRMRMKLPSRWSRAGVTSFDPRRLSLGGRREVEVSR